MQPNQQQDNVWISREEYERLHRMASQVSPQPVVYSDSNQVTDEPAKVKPIQTVIGTILAVGLFLSLTVPFFIVISLPILGILLIFAVMSFNDFRKGKQQSGTNTPFSANTAALENGKKGSGKYNALLVILLATLAAPVLFIGGMLILFFMFLAAGGAAGGGKGS